MMAEDKIKNKIIRLQKAKELIEREILDLAGYHLLRKPYFSVVSDIDCIMSPCGLCCYDHHFDRAHDHCIFCGEPEERK